MFHPYLRNQLFSESEYRDSEDRGCFFETFLDRVFRFGRFDFGDPENPELEIFGLTKLKIPRIFSFTNPKTSAKVTRCVYSMGKRYILLAFVEGLRNGLKPQYQEAKAQNKVLFKIPNVY